MSVVILGRGKVGRALFAATRAAGIEAALISSRRPPSHLPRASLYVLAVPDFRLRALAAELAPALPPRSALVHCAGARSHEELAAARNAGVSIGAMHPLLSFADRARPPNMHGATFVIQGDAPARAQMKRFLRALGARCVAHSVLGPGYHAAAALVANGGAALTHIGVRILEQLGFSQREARRALAHLLRSVADNVEHLGLPAALTGPLVRGDAITVAAHLEALAALDPALLSAYGAVQPLVLACAKDAGLDARSARTIERTLERAQHARRQRKT